MEYFIKSIHINKVRHLENLDILLSNTQRKFLILTEKKRKNFDSSISELNIT